MLTEIELERSVPEEAQAVELKLLERAPTRLAAPTREWRHTFRKSGFLPRSHFRNVRSATILLATTTL
jgi:hypothetical protein